MFDVNQLQRKTNLRIVEINGIMCVCVCSNRTVCHINVHNVSVWFIQGCQIRQISFSLFGSVSEPLFVYLISDSLQKHNSHQMQIFAQLCFVIEYDLSFCIVDYIFEV